MTRRGIWFWVLARPVFRTVDFHTSYASARRLRRNAGTVPVERLAALAERKRGLHTELAALSASHGEACAACKGGCCTEERFRDSLVDRLLAGPGLSNTAPRSLRDAYRETETAYPPLRDGLPSTPGYCPNCTPEGCIVAPSDRPVQCLAYQCRATIATLDDAELDRGIRAITELMHVMVETARSAGRGRGTPA